MPSSEIYTLLAFNVGGAANLVLDSMVGAVRADFSESVGTRFEVSADMMVGSPMGMLSMIPTRVAIVRDKNKKMEEGFMLEFCIG